MQVSVEATGTITRRMTVTVPAEELENAIVARLKNLSGQVKIPGFRPGKVPMKMMESQYGGRVMQEVTGELIQSSFQRALGQEQLNPAGGPRIEPKSLERGKALEYIAEFDVFPEIPRSDLSGETIEQPLCVISDKDVDATIETLRKQRTAWKPVERESREGDRVTVDFTGTIDGMEFEGGKASDIPVVLGSGTMIKGFEEGLAGRKAGEQGDLQVTFPDDYGAKELAGKSAVFAFTIKEVTEPELPEVNEEFIRQMGVESGDVTKFRAEVKGSLEREAQTRVRGVVRNRVMEALMRINEFEVPRGLINEELARMRQADAQQRKAQGMPASSGELEQELYRKAAEGRVKLSLIVSETVDKHNIEVDAERLRARIEEMASSYEHPEAFTKWYYERPERLAEMEALVMEDKVVDALLETAKVEGKPVDFTALIELSKTGNHV